jgi:serine/threonine protein kinase
MQHAHDRGIIHRDLKPANVLFITDEIPKITDFGLAKFRDAMNQSENPQTWIESITPQAFTDLTQKKYDSGCIEETPGVYSSKTIEDFVVHTESQQNIGAAHVEDERRFDDSRQFIQGVLRQASSKLPGESRARQKLTESGAIMGTPQYMAPEQAAGLIEKVGPPADIYSLGAIMYEMLTGRPPFTGDPLQVITQVISTPPVPPRQRRDSIDPALSAICMKCLEKTAERRYQSMGQLAEDLQRFMNGAEVSALSETSPSNAQIHSDDVPQGSSRTHTRARSTTLQAGAATAKSWWQFWR